MEFFRLQRNYASIYWEAAPDPFPHDLMEYILADTPMNDNCRYELLCGRRPGDMISLSAWSDAMIAVFTKCQATGLRTAPIQIHAKNKVYGGYQRIKVIGRGGPLDDVRSHVIRQDDEIASYRGIYIDESKWDGSDVFSIPGLGIFIFVVPRVADALRRAKLTNIELIPNSECSFS